MADLDCEQVLQMVWQYLDGEVDEARYLEIRSHIQACSGCGPRYEFQRRLRELIERKCREGPAPPELKRRLFRLLET
ncbi:MAG: mycothiol system anti-sigma-R factor [Armatimonadota bacterium]|nr:mycothiol system anti-sigma-R factor [Armatimonadota bacterium]MDR7402549.1 mycothiol system anti-sigma-R factor [Armatimonadota bacterium]MDR7403852.1 mycothiol system anti-sigma-R factor [Armatimonadota bacterium]MDR7436067.1 mycothiol system anti-sigma-R factor [Armatimonadota bacterium]MDR7471946.1 mycothiol system anti-sigma-R factor [Armatimonadota bacterium]